MLNYQFIKQIRIKDKKKISTIVKQRIEILINLYVNLIELAKVVQQRIKKYYNAKRSKGLDFKEGDKIQLLHKNFKS